MQYVHIYPQSIEKPEQRLEMVNTYLKMFSTSLINNLSYASFENFTILFCIKFANIKLADWTLKDQTVQYKDVWEEAWHYSLYLKDRHKTHLLLDHLRLFLLHFMMIFVLFLLPTELFSPRHEATTTCNDHFKQFCLLAGIWRYLCLWVSGWQRLSELLLLLWRMQIRILEKRAYPHRHLGAGLIFAGLFPHIVPALQLGLLGWIPLSLNVAIVMSEEH